MTVAAIRGPLGRGHRGEHDRVEGYQVIMIDGGRVGTIVASDENGLVVRCGSWPRRSLRALPVGQAVIRDVDRTVLMLVSPETLPRLTASNRVTVAAAEERRARPSPRRKQRS
jgi:hypothetical protein